MNTAIEFLQLEGNRIGQNGGEVGELGVATYLGGWRPKAGVLLASDKLTNIYLTIFLPHISKTPSYKRFHNLRFEIPPSFPYLFFFFLQALVTAMRVSHGNLIVGMTNCDTSHRDEALFNAAGATGAYDLDLQVGAAV